jgi:Protein of unknown function (DUF3617)
VFRFGTAGSFASRRIAASLLCSVAYATTYAAAPGLYEVTARTVMPHLEENLRYATTREQHCLQLDQPAPLFPIMRHPSLEGCHLGDELRHGSDVRYRLVCASPQVASGTARLDIAGERIAGILEIKMGGKNMTFSQSIEAVRQRDCEPLQRR